VTSTQTPKQPTWGRLIQARREQQGRSVRQAALIADISDAYWGQVEKGYVKVKGEARPVTPSRRALIAIADSLRMTSKETGTILEAAGHKGYIPGESIATRASEVDLTGLSRRDIALLNALADRFREVIGDTAVEKVVEPTPLRRVARGRPTSPAPDRESAAEKAAREAAARNPEGRPKK
jgi:transcriptional regulator with XRE-family HTH domain